MQTKLTRYLTIVLLALALLGLAAQLYPALFDYANYAQIALTYPYSLDYGEGPLLDQTVRLAHFENIYRNTFSSPPYTISNYPPLFPLVQVPFEWIFGPALWYGRAISILGVLLTALFIGLTLFALTGDWVGSAVGGLLLLTIPYIEHWSLFNRIDELALVLSWAGLFVLVKFVGLKPFPAAKSIPVTGLAESAAALPRSGWWFAVRMDARAVLAQKSFWAAVVLFVAAIFTRQTYALAAPFAAFFWLIFASQGTWRQRLVRAFLLGAAVALISLALFLLINLFTAGGFYLNIVVANVNTFYWKTVNNYVKEIRERFYPLLWLAGAFLVFERWVPSWRTKSWALVLPYLLAAGAGSVTIGKDGSNVNYLLELSAAFSLAGGAALAWVGRWKWLGWRTLARLVVIGVIAFQATIFVGWMRESFAPYLIDRSVKIGEVAQVEQLIKQTPGLVLADEYMGLVPLAGKPLYFQPFEFKQMYDAGLWDQKPFLADIASHKFALIVWYQPSSWNAIEARYTTAQREMVLASYKLDQSFGDIYVYVPK